MTPPKKRDIYKGLKKTNTAISYELILIKEPEVYKFKFSKFVDKLRDHIFIALIHCVEYFINKSITIDKRFAHNNNRN